MQGVPRIERKLGRAFLELPWSSSTAARDRAMGKTRQAVETLERRLEDSWRADEPWHEMGAALVALYPGDGVCMVFRATDQAEPSIISHDADGQPALAFPSYCSMSGMLRAGRWGRDHAAFPGRPASLAALVASIGDLDAGLAGFQEVYPTGVVRNQLRTVMTATDPGAVTCFVGTMRFGERGYSLDEHQRLHAVQPAIQRWVRHMKALGRSPFEASGLPVATLDAFRLPAVVVHRGRIVHANAIARACPRLPTDVEQLRARATSRQLFATRLSDEFELLILPPDPVGPSIDDLPPALRSVATLLATGASDKEIAQALERPLSTVRTYTRRVFRRLGIHDRRELIRRFPNDAP